MSTNASSEPTRTETRPLPRRIKNTFAPHCKNEYFTPATLAGLCRYGFPYGDLPEEGKQMVDGYMKEYRKRCSNDDGRWEPKPTPGGFKGRGCM